VKYSELLKLFRQRGIIFIQHGKRHDLYYSPITHKKIPVPRHSAEIPTGTLNNILKDAGIEEVKKK